MSETIKKKTKGPQSKMKFDLDSEAHWQAYRIANVFLAWKADIPDQKRQAVKIVMHVIKQWYRLGRRHERIEKKIKKVRQLECGDCGVHLSLSNWGGYRREWPGDLKEAKIALDIGICKKCYYAKYENFEVNQGPSALRREPKSVHEAPGMA